MLGLMSTEDSVQQARVPPENPAQPPVPSEMHAKKAVVLEINPASIMALNQTAANDLYQQAFLDFGHPDRNDPRLDKPSKRSTQGRKRNKRGLNPLTAHQYFNSVTAVPRSRNIANNLLNPIALFQATHDPYSIPYNKPLICPSPSQAHNWKKDVHKPMQRHESLQPVDQQYTMELGTMFPCEADCTQAYIVNSYIRPRKMQYKRKGCNHTMSGDVGCDINASCPESRNGLVGCKLGSRLFRRTSPFRNHPNTRLKTTPPPQHEHHSGLSPELQLKQIYDRINTSIPLPAHPSPDLPGRKDHSAALSSMLIPGSQSITKGPLSRNSKGRVSRDRRSKQHAYNLPRERTRQRARLFGTVGSKESLEGIIGRSASWWARC
jgi:hypothetical protein